MSFLEICIILVAGLWAGAINTIVGSGTLVTFPVLVSMGVPPVTATISNAMGLIAGNFTGAWGYRKELKGLETTLWKLVPCSLAGGILGAYLLLHLPASVFESISPVLIGIALLFVIFQPKLQAVVRKRREGKSITPADGDHQPPILYALVFFAGVYGGYFVAAQGVLLLGILGVFLLASLQGANAIKTVLVAAVNLIAGISYVLFAFDRIDWWVVLLIAISSTIGSWVGAKIGRRMKPAVLRTIIVILGLAAIVKMVFLD
ncbi:sulfite exporter TauE/SafE family protein [Kocuria massiliensis]|uniref:sulfite exporter TauE/SafE family protein n=1 Tax=Kocuria massiliensis TaxID=1926282 RepID=UPI0022B9A535|nr:sulfite exporter TauE/SafE family protein [Kocuria massiliensis]